MRTDCDQGAGLRVDRSDLKICCGDALEQLRELESDSIDCCVTSPPYWSLRDYGVEGQIGLEPTIEEHFTALRSVFAEVFRVLKPAGTLWVNMGDAYVGAGRRGGRGWQRGRPHLSHDVTNQLQRPAGLKPKDLMGLPWRLAFALQEDGWFLRQDIIWAKPTAMPESVSDRCTKSHEYLFLLSKERRYYFDGDAIAEPVSRGSCGSRFDRGATAQRQPGASAGVREERETRNKRSVWSIVSEQRPKGHLATFPTELARTCIRAGCPKDGWVLDPFFGTGTTAVAAHEEGCRAIGIEINPEYCAIAEERLRQQSLLTMRGSA